MSVWSPGAAVGSETTITVVGIDLSLTSTGLASIVTGPTGTGVHTDRVRTREKGHERLQLILHAIHQWCDGPTTLVVLEGPSYGSQSSTYHQLAGLWWLVRHQLWQQGLPVAVVAPQARAKYASGKGNAGKDEVLAAVLRRYAVPLDIDVGGNDVADALTLAAMGARHLRRAIEERIPEVNLAALAKVEWPRTLADEDGAD